MSSRALKKVVKQYVKGAKSAASGYERLSDREREVLKLLADGLALKEIAVQLVLSVKTVDAHKTNLMRKLDLHDRSELIKYAIQRKLIRLPSVKLPGEALPELNPSEQGGPAGVRPPPRPPVSGRMKVRSAKERRGSLSVSNRSVDCSRVSPRKMSLILLTRTEGTNGFSI